MTCEELKWNIFCTVVDNYGDIGVTWHLAKEMRRLGQSVRIFIDKPEVMAVFEKEIDPAKRIQTAGNGITVEKWDDDCEFESLPGADAVIEMFACRLPDRCIDKMKGNCLWLNVEYLTAEDWIEDCHGLKSLERGREKYFFFPGFTGKTGGINFESQKDPYSSYVNRIFEKIKESAGSEAMIFSAFTYENNVMAGIITEYDFAGKEAVFIVPEGMLLSQLLKRHKDRIEMISEDAIGDGRSSLWKTESGSLMMAVPMLSQEDYDEILRRCCFCFVRGEDSFVRVQMAAKPFIWHIYPQNDDAHIAKLEAFMNRYTSAFEKDLANAYKAFALGFNRNDKSCVSRYFPQIMDGLSTAYEPAEKWKKAICDNGSLAFNLIRFAHNRQKSYN